VHREYQNALYNYKENRPLTPVSTSLLPIEYLDYSPDMACRPTVFFPNVQKGKYSVCTNEGTTAGVSTSKGLRRSLRKTRVVIGDSDDENKSQRRCEGVKIQVFVMLKLDFGLWKKGKALVGKGDTL